MLRLGNFWKKKTTDQWPMDAAGPALLALVQGMLGLVNRLSVSPMSQSAKGFSENLASLSGTLNESEGRPATILGVANDLEHVIGTYGAWQSAEVTHTVDAMTQMLKVLAETLKESVAELEEASPDFDALSEAIENVNKAQSIEEVRAALDGQSRRLEHLKELQSRQRSRYNRRLEATIQTLESELATVIRDSQFDSLTGALNRTGFEVRFSEAKLRLHEGRWTLAILDLDGFKMLNDSLGHLAGDSALKAFREALSDMAPEATICRYGGDEFVVLAHQDSMCMRSSLSKFRAKLPKREIRVEGPQGALTMRLATSYGITELLPSDSIDAAIARADAELYEMKRHFSQDRAA